jgi:endo-1,4-beta-xylanase
MVKNMKFSPRQSRWAFGAVTTCLAVGAITACTDAADPGGENGSAGASTGATSGRGAGGSGGSGGGAGTSSVGGSGGMTGSGGAAPLGGQGGSSGAGTGGTGGSGGASGSGGMSVTGGSSGNGGSSGGAQGGSAGTTGGAGGNGALGGRAGLAGAGGVSGSAGGGGDGGSGGMANPCPPATPLTGGQEYCSNATGNIAGGYSYELWAEGPGTHCMRVYGKDANFSANWTGVEDFLARIGLKFDETKTHQQIGTIKATFAETQTGSEDGLTYIGIYGWTLDPLREYYILDDWGATKPAGIASDGTPRDSVGQITVDGGTYDVWKKTRVDKPAITGDHMTFDQYFSIRTVARQCGTISVSEHFTKWEGLGLPMGKMYEAKILAESQNNSGTIAFTTATVTVD